jgi:hypothetical protein
MNSTTDANFVVTRSTANGRLASFFQATEAGESNTHPQQQIVQDKPIIEDGTMSNGVQSKLLLTYAVILAVAVVLLNSCIYFAVLYLKRNRFNPSNLIVLNLATADLMVALVYLPILSTFIIRETKLRCETFCSVLSILERTFVAESAWSVVIVSLDRYLFVVKHAKYKSIMTFKRAVYGVVITWLISITFGVTSYFVNRHNVHTKAGNLCSCHFSIDFYGVYHLIFSAAYIAICLIIPTTLMFIFYGFVIRIARHHAKNRYKNPFRLRRSRVGVDEHSRNNHTLDMNHASVSHEYIDDQKPVKLYRVKAARIIFFVLTLHLLCFTPYFILNIMLTTWPYEHETSKTSVNLYMAFILLLLTPSAFNPIFYGLANRRLRNSLIIYARQNIFKINGAGHYGERHKKGGSKLSIMADSSSGATRRGSRASDVSALSALSSSAFVCRDLLEVYSVIPTEDATAQTNSNTATHPYARRKRNKVASTPHDEDENNASSCSTIADLEVATTPTFDVHSNDSGRQKSSKNTSGKIKAVPNRQRLPYSDGNRSIALRKIAEAAMLFAVSDDEARLSSSPESCRSQGNLTPRSPTIAWHNY